MLKGAFCIPASGGGERRTAEIGEKQMQEKKS